MTTNPEGMMSMREILIKYGQSCYKGFQDPDATLAAIKEELLRVIPDIKQFVEFDDYPMGHNACRSQMITAIETLFEEK